MRCSVVGIAASNRQDFRPLPLVYAEVVNALPDALIACVLAVSAWAQTEGSRLPRFEDYPVTEVFSGKPAKPILQSPDELKFQTVIRDGVNKGWGVYDGISGKELDRSAPNFAGSYTLIAFGCGERDLTDCLMAAIVDRRTGHVYRPPSPVLGMPYFGVHSQETTHHPPFSFHGGPEGEYAPFLFPFEYRLNSRLLVARVCEGNDVQGGSQVQVVPRGCGPHFYLMEEGGLKLIDRVVEPLKTYLPRFEDHPVKDLLTGAPVAPNPVTLLAQRYRTKIQDAIEKSKGKDGELKPSFAGRYNLAYWECGASCMMMVLVDSYDGTIHEPPLCRGRCGTETLECPVVRPGFTLSAVEFRTDSRLLRITVNDQKPLILKDSTNSVTLTLIENYYFIWQDGGWKLLQRAGDEKVTAGVLRHFGSPISVGPR